MAFEDNDVTKMMGAAGLPNQSVANQPSALPGMGVGTPAPDLTNTGYTPTDVPRMSADLTNAINRVYSAKYRAGANSALGVANLVANREGGYLTRDTALMRDTNPLARGIAQAGINQHANSFSLETNKFWDEAKRKNALVTQPTLGAGGTAGTGGVSGGRLFSSDEMANLAHSIFNTFK